MNPIDRLALSSLIGFLLAFAITNGELPNPIQPKVESPFPAEGSWLLLAADASDLSGVLMVGNAADLEAFENKRILDFDDVNDEPEPWPTALKQAEEKGGRKPYFFARKGNKAAEGLVNEDVEKMFEETKRVLGIE